MLKISSNPYSPSAHLNNKPSFKSVILSRVVLRTVNANNEIIYTPLMNNEKGIVGIYQSLALKINQNKGKDKNIINKLKEVIPDLRKNKPIIHSTIVGTRSRFKRFLLTGSDAKRIRDYGTDLIGALNNRQVFANSVRNDILNDSSRRLFNSDGDEIAIDLIVEGPFRKRKLVDVDVCTLSEISKAKPSVSQNPQPLTQLRTPRSTATTPNTVKEEPTPVQKTFDFLDEIQEPTKNNHHYYD